MTLVELVFIEDFQCASRSFSMSDGLRDRSLCETLASVDAVVAPVKLRSRLVAVSGLLDTSSRASTSLKTSMGTKSTARRISTHVCACRVCLFTHISVGEACLEDAVDLLDGNGAKDCLGCFKLLTPAIVREASKEANEGISVPLN